MCILYFFSFSSQWGLNLQLIKSLTSSQICSFLTCICRNLSVCNVQMMKCTRPFPSLICSGNVTPLNITTQFFKLYYIAQVKVAIKLDAISWNQIPLRSKHCLVAHPKRRKSVNLKHRQRHFYCQLCNNIFDCTARLVKNSSAAKHLREE